MKVITFRLLNSLLISALFKVLRMKKSFFLLPVFVEWRRNERRFKVVSHELSLLVLVKTKFDDVKRRRRRLLTKMDREKVKAL